MKKFFKKIARFISKNILLSVLIFLFLIIIILGIVAIKVLIFPSYSTSKYGNRLDNIDAFNIDDSRIDEIKNNFEFDNSFNFNGFRLSGKIVNLFFVVDGSLEVTDVKDKAFNFINNFSKEELNYFDFQVFVTCSCDSDQYPMLAYKNKDSEGLY